jgi:hypothetical protein
MTALDRVAVYGAMALMFVAIGLATLAVKPDGLEPRLAFASLVGLLMAGIIVNLRGIE